MSEHLAARRRLAAAPPPDPRTPGTAGFDEVRLPAERRAVPLTGDTHLAVHVRELVGRGLGDQAREVFAALVELHQRRALHIAYRFLGDRAEAEDAVQDAFLKVYSRIATYRDVWPFGVWFTRILVNECLDRRKSRARRARWLGVLSASDAPGLQATAHDTPETVLLARERWARLAKAVDTLAGRQRTALLLCYFGDSTPQEVGAVMGLAESTVRVHIFRAVQRLRHLLGGRS